MTLRWIAAAFVAVFAIAVVVAAIVVALSGGLAPVSVTATPSSSASAPAASASSPGSGAPATPTPVPVAIDPGLLDVLPVAVDGLPVVESPEGEAAAEKDTALPKVATGVASGLAIDASSGDFVYAVVVRLRQGAMDDATFRDWRDSYDEGACSQANGVDARAETTIAGRTVFIATCGGGVRTYHVWIASSQLLVSASAVGDERRLGEKLVQALRPD